MDASLDIHRASILTQLQGQCAYMAAPRSMSAAAELDGSLSSVVAARHNTWTWMDGLVDAQLELV